MLIPASNNVVLLHFRMLKAKTFADGCSMNLEGFIAMRPTNEQGSTAHGQVLNEEDFFKWAAAEGHCHEPVGGVPD